METLRSRLRFEPHPLRFGTSGRRGEVIHLTQLEIYINALAEARYLQSLPLSEGGIARGEEFYIGYDLRPSSTQYVGEQGRGEIAQAVCRAVSDAGLQPVNLGVLPTPALASYAFERHKGSIMVTGSHIPFDRNGYKLNTSRGELLKQHEGPITAAVECLRQEIYGRSFATSLFDENGAFKSGHHDMPPENADGRGSYLRRYLSFFGRHSLRGMRILVYQHSAVARDLLAQLLRDLGAEAIPAGKSDAFVPIDTENIDAAQLTVIQSLADEAARTTGALDAIVSTDGDSDRPLILGVQHDGTVAFFGGDLVGMITAEYLEPDAVVVPVTCNDAIDRSALGPILQPKTRIGSPYVIAGMERAKACGRNVVCGWEANGGFLLGSDLEREGKTLRALPTRDAFLPILCTLFSAREKSLSLTELFESLPRRFSRAALLKNFPRSVSEQMMERFSPPHGAAELQTFFQAENGFSDIRDVDYTDGVRIAFDNGEVAHIRPSGNADELRFYAVADSQQRANEIAAIGIAEPGGILRRMASSLVA